MTKISSMQQKREFGGAAVEYIIVSLFAAIVAMTSVAYVGKLVKERVEAIAEKMGIEGKEFELDENLF